MFYKIEPKKKPLDLTKGFWYNLINIKLQINIKSRDLKILLYIISSKQNGI